MRKIAFFWVVLSLLLSPLAYAGGGGGGGKSKFDWKKSSLITVANTFVEAVSAGKYEEAYKLGGDILRKSRTLDEFTADMKRWRIDRPGSVEWTNGNGALPAGNGFKLMGTYTAKAKEGQEAESFPVYMHFQGDAHVPGDKRVRKWNEKTLWTVMDYKSAEGMRKRISDGRGSPLDWFLVICAFI